MAVITHLPAPEVIYSFRGILDYACWRGILYVRKWPRSPSLPRSPAVQATAAAFADISRRLSATDPYLQAQWAAEGEPTWTWKDAATSAMYGNAWVE